METIHYNMDGVVLTINYPNDELGNYTVETEHDIEIGQLFIEGMDEDLHTPIWRGTTEEVNRIAAELGEFIERSDL
jgi:hypothetical protein